MKKYSWLFCLFMVVSTVGCGGAPTPVEVPESEDSAINMSEDEIEDEMNIGGPGE